MAGAVVLAVVVGGTIPAAAASAAPGAPSASIPGTVRPQAGISSLSISFGTKVSCGSSTACLAVGNNTNNSTGDSTPIAEALSGTKWKSVPVKTPKAASTVSLSGVSCKAASYCLVVGDYTTTASDLPYVLTWNGSTLTPITAPPQPKGGQLYAIGAVSCVAVKKCVVFGLSLIPGATVAFRVFTDTWNGSKWTEVTSASPAGSAIPDLTALHCLSTTSCVVAGTAFSTGDGSPSVLVAAWNGKTWTRQKAATPAGELVLVNDLSCVSTTSCAAVGLSLNVSASGDSSSGFGFLMNWNGKAWSEVKWQGPKGDTEALVLGVSCVSASNCMAVGAAGTSKSGAAAALSWNGTKWTAVSVPAPAKGDTSEFAGVSCPKTGDCVATGEVGPNSASTPAQLAGYWNGKAWKLAAA
jgi:hypothetical protein